MPFTSLGSGRAGVFWCKNQSVGGGSVSRGLHLLLMEKRSVTHSSEYFTTLSFFSLSMCTGKKIRRRWGNSPPELLWFCNQTALTFARPLSSQITLPHFFLTRSLVASSPGSFPTANKHLMRSTWHVTQAFWCQLKHNKCNTAYQCTGISIEKGPKIFARMTRTEEKNVQFLQRLTSCSHNLKAIWATCQSCQSCELWAHELQGYLLTATGGKRQGCHMVVTFGTVYVQGPFNLPVVECMRLTPHAVLHWPPVYATKWDAESPITQT